MSSNLFLQCSMFPFVRASSCALLSSVQCRRSAFTSCPIHHNESHPKWQSAPERLRLRKPVPQGSPGGPLHHHECYSVFGVRLTTLRHIRVLDRVEPTGLRGRGPRHLCTNVYMSPLLMTVMWTRMTTKMRMRMRMRINGVQVEKNRITTLRSNGPTVYIEP